MSRHIFEQNTIEQFTVGNGLKVIAIPSKQAPVVSLQGWVRFGSADETEEIAGVAHLFEHLLFKGTKTRPVGTMAKEVEGMGGDINAYTSYDQTVMHMTLPSHALSSGLDILSDALMNSVVESDELERERPVIIEEIKRRNDMPGSRALDLLREGLFQKHPYARPVIGYASVVSNISRERILEQYHSWYNTSNVFLVVAGDFETKKLRADCERLFAPMRKGVTPPVRPVMKSVSGKKTYFENHPTFPDPLVHLGWHAPAGDDDLVAVWDALALILGQGESSRLVKKLIFEEKLVREIGCSTWNPKNMGSFVISMRGSPGLSKNFSKVLRSISEVLEHPIESSELEKAKKNLLSSATYSKETVDGLAQRYGYFEAIAGSWELDQKYLDRVWSLSVHEVDELRQKLLSWDNCVAGGIFPAKEKLPEFEIAPARPVKSSLAKMQKDKKVSHGVVSFNFNGLKVLVRPLKHLPIFSARWVGMGGNRIEKESETGLGSLWNRTVTTGGRGLDGKIWDRNSLNDLIDRSSASLSSFHGRNSFGYQLDGLSEDFEDLFDVMLAVKNNPEFNEDILKHERDLFVADIKSAQDSASNVLSQLFSKTMFGTHPYGRSSFENMAAIKKFSSKNLRAYHQRLHQQPQVLSIVGDIDPERVHSFLQTHLDKAAFPTVGKLLKPMALKYPKKSIEIRRKLKKEQTHILIGYPTCTLFDKERWSLMALSSLLSGQGGRLFIELRDKLSLAYTVAPTHMEGLDGGYFGFYIATSPEKEKTAREGLQVQIEKIIKEGFTDAELDSAKKFYTGNHLIEQQKFSSQSITMALDEVYGIGFEEFFKFEEMFNSVQKSDIQKAVKKFFGANADKPSVTSVVGPK